MRLIDGFSRAGGLAFGLFLLLLSVSAPLAAQDPCIGCGIGPPPVSALCTAVSSTTGNGSIDPSGPQIVTCLAAVTFTFTLTPNSGQSIVSVTSSCGGSLSGNTFTTGASAMFSTCTVIANFGIPVPTYTLTYTAGANGTISGTSPQTVNSGDSGSAILAVPNAGYSFAQWSDGVTTNPRIDSNVTPARPRW